MQPIVNLLHVIDTEGPLFEAPTETVARVNRSLGLSLPVSERTLEQLRRGEIALGDKGPLVETLLRYSHFLGDWSQLDAMLARVTATDFRQANADSSGRPWRYNWHTLDHVGYEVNPRRRDIGHHNVFDHYQELVAAQQQAGDELGFHFHPSHFYPHAQLSATTFSTSPHLYPILSRKLIERRWFPRSFRAGFHSERPDSHLFLEQWIPHDFSNQSILHDRSVVGQRDLSDHRFGDWSRAPTRWGYYHPHHDDYQSEGQCRRRIYRCLNIGTRLRCIDAGEVERAFEQAAAEKAPVWVGVTNHDFRDMAPDVQWLKHQFDDAARRTGVPWRSCNVSDTFADVAAPPQLPEVTLSRDGLGTKLSLVYPNEIFGPQPFLALKLVNELFRHSNFDIVTPFRRFSYIFDEHSVPYERVEQIVVGTNDRHGNAIVTVVKD